MGILVHHEPASNASSCKIHVWQAAWDGDIVLDTNGTLKGTVVDFHLPDVPDPRKLQFKYYSTSPAEVWEPDDFIRRLYLQSPPEIWTFASSPRILFQDPYPAGVTFKAGDVLTFQAITRSAYRGGQLYVWNPYDTGIPAIYFNESARNDSKSTSTFSVTLAPWMTSGFNLKLMQPRPGQGAPGWEPDSSNRVWRPCDGPTLWLKSGQCDLRSSPLALTPVAIEVLYSAMLAAPPALALWDAAENSSFLVVSSTSRTYTGSPLFNVGYYTVSIYPGAAYSISSTQNVENRPIGRPFPADPTVPAAVSRFALGAGSWVNAFPALGAIPVVIQPKPVSSFAGGLSVEASVGNGPVYDRIAATLQSDGTWQATLQLLLETTGSIDLRPATGAEPKPYDQIDTSRYFTATAATSRLHTTEGVYGICIRGGTQFAEPPNRGALMQAAFGPVGGSAGVFANREMPHGATLLASEVFFVVHAPHSVCSTLVLVNETSVGGPARASVPMTLTGDTIYWWCKVSAAQAPPGTRYRFLLNDDVEVIDPASRAVRDAGQVQTGPADSPGDKSTSWSLVLDVAGAVAAAHVQQWQTMGWQQLLIYELHAARFTNLNPAGLQPFDLLADELQPMSRRGQPGYLRQLPVTTFELLPVSEFNSSVGWGYDPSYYFAIDEYYGGAPALARFVNSAHATGRGVMLDLVYNHSSNSSLMRIAPDVYRYGAIQWGGDRMNCGHPMLSEFLRQATIYLFHTFNLDGFRFDDTQDIVGNPNGWGFLGTIRGSLRGAAAAEGRAWPFCVAENYATIQWDISNPSYGVMDGQWGIDESYRIEDASYNARYGGDSSGPLKREMDNPSYPGRPFYQAVRFGESHDIVSCQDPMQKDQRIAARPPFGQGYQLAKAFGALALLSNGVPMLFMGQEVGETAIFTVHDNNEWINPQAHDLPPSAATDNTRILAWFRQLMGLRNDPSKGLQGESNYQVVATGNRTVAFTCGSGQRLFTVVTFGTPDQQQDSSWLGLPGGTAYKEIFNSSWPVFQVEFEQEQTNGGYDAEFYSGGILNLPYMGAVVLERR